MDMLKIPQWIKTARKEDDDMPDEMSIPTAAALLPPPTMRLPPEPVAPPDLDSNDVLTNAVTARANALKFLADVKREQERSQIELAEMVLALEGEKKKVALLEQEVAERHVTIVELQNDRASLQLELTKKNKFLSLIRGVCDQEGIEAPPKKERKSKPAKPKAAAAA